MRRSKVKIQGQKRINVYSDVMYFYSTVMRCLALLWELPHIVQSITYCFNIDMVLSQISITLLLSYNLEL